MDDRVRSRMGRAQLAIMAAVAGSLLAAGLLFGGFLWIDGISYRYWPAQAEFNDQQPAHEVEVEPGQTFMLWKHANFDTPECRVTELPSGTAVSLRNVEAEGWNRGGGAVTVVAFAEGRSNSDRISVSCAPLPPSPYSSDQPAQYFVDAANGPAAVDGFGPLWPAPVALAGGGLVLMVAAGGVLLVRRRSTTAS